MIVSLPSYSRRCPSHCQVYPEMFVGIYVYAREIERMCFFGAGIACNRDRRQGETGSMRHNLAPDQRQEGCWRAKMNVIRRHHVQFQI